MIASPCCAMVDGYRRAPSGDASPDQLVRMMVGPPVDMSYPRKFAETPGKVLLEVKGLSAATGSPDIDLIVREGEIVRLCGLVGSGRTEVVRAIFGADENHAGQIIFNGQPTSAVRSGRALGLAPDTRKPEDRRSRLLRSVGDNLVVSALRQAVSFRPVRAAPRPGRCQ